MPFTTNPGGFFRQSDPMMSGMGALTNSRNWTNPGYAANPFQSGSMANAGLNMMMPGMGMVMGKGGGSPGTAYAVNQFDPNSVQARSDITNYLNNGAAQQRQAYQDQIQRGIQNRVATKMMENARKVGPNLAGTEVKSLPGFLSGGQSVAYSGADRGTAQGAALQNAVANGQMTTPDIQVSLGAKGTPTGLANEAIPKMVNMYPISPLMPATQIFANTQAQANQMNQSSGGGGK